MKRRYLEILSAILAVLFAGAAETRTASWRCDFSDSKQFSTLWKFEGAKLFVPKTKFYLARAEGAENRRVLVIQSDKATGLLMTAPANVDLNKTPILRWRWRVVKPVNLKPEHRKSSISEPDDQAVTVYFGDGNTLRQKSIAYRWEAKTPLEHTGICSYLGGVMTVNYRCVRNDTTPPGEWVVESRDVLADFRKAYRVDPDKKFILSIGGNSQYTASNTHAEIDYLEFVPRGK